MSGWNEEEFSPLILYYQFYKRAIKKKQNDNPRNLKFLDGYSAFLYGEHLSQTSIFKKSGSSYSKNRDLVSPK